MSKTIPIVRYDCSKCPGYCCSYPRIEVKDKDLARLAKHFDLSKADAERTLAAFFDLIVASTKKGEKVAWPGFGSFSTTDRKERTGRNPQTGAAVTVPASTAMKFTASSTLKAQLNPNRK